ncbi:MAG: sugar kinase, partial [Bacteroidota bacterium]|nr:sugar kinase [Bacteroidota bacterium]
YDRAHSAFAEWDPATIRWTDVLEGARWFHVTGITPALSPGCEKAVREAVRTAREIAVPVSFDLNYRRNLWPLSRAKETLQDLASACDVLIANEEDAILMFDFERPVSDPHSGRIDEREYERLARHIAARCGVPTVAITLRESLSASRNGWSGLLLQAGALHRSRRYELDVVDRVGTGDAFTAGIIHGILLGWEGERTVEFAAAASALKHTIGGDFNPVSVDQVNAVARGELSGRVKR